MPESRQLLSSLSFIVKLWIERGSPSNLRGRITRVSEQGQDEQKPVSQLTDITEFIETSLEKEGVKIYKTSRIWRWIRRAPIRGRR